MLLSLRQPFAWERVSHATAETEPYMYWVYAYVVRVRWLVVVSCSGVYVHQYVGMRVYLHRVRCACRIYHRVTQTHTYI